MRSTERSSRYTQLTNRLSTTIGYRGSRRRSGPDGFALIGEHDRAFLWLDRSVDYGYANVRFLSECEPFLVNLQSDARFKVLMDKATRVSESLGE